MKIWEIMKKNICLSLLLLLLSFSVSIEASLTNPLNLNYSDKKIMHPQKEMLIEKINGFLDAIRLNKPDVAYKDFTSKEFQKKTSLENFKNIIAEKTHLYKNKLFQYRSFFVEDNIATFQGDHVFQDGSTISSEYDFIQEGKDWKIMGLQFFKPEEMSIPINTPIPEIINELQSG